MQEFNNGNSGQVLCLLIGEFGLTWDPVWLCIRSLDQHRLIPGDHLWNFLKRKPRKYPGALKINILKTAIFHFATCYPTIKDQLSKTFHVNLPKSLVAHLPYGSSTIRQWYRCLCAGCHAFVSRSVGLTGGRKSVKPTDDLVKHIKKDHPDICASKESLETVPLEWTQIVRKKWF